MKQLPKLVAFGLLGTILSGCGKEPAEKPIRPVRSIKVGDVQAISGRGFPGKAKATDELNMSFRVSGPLVEFKVKVGDQVDAGDVLVRIDPRDFRVQLRRSEANLQRGQANLKAMQTARPADIRLLKLDVDSKQAEFDKAESVWKRNEPLVKTGAVTLQEFDILTAAKDIAEAARDSAGESLEKAKAGAREEDKEAQEAEITSLEAAVEDAQNRLEYTELKAPFKGTVTATYVENYETVQAKQQILRIVNSLKIEMIIDIPEQLISLIPYAKDIKCKFDAFPEVEVLAKIHEIGAEASQKTRTYPVTLIMDQPKGVTILPGMAGIATGRAEIPDTMNLDGYEIPETAIMEGDGEKGSVWLIDESSDPPTVTRLEVTRHPSHSLTPQGVRVTGLSVGQRIATAGVHYLKEGQEVRVME